MCKKTKAVAAPGSGKKNNVSPPSPSPDQPPRLAVCLNDTPVEPDREKLRATDETADPPGNKLKDSAKILTPEVVTKVLTWIGTRLDEGLNDAWAGPAGKNDEFNLMDGEEKWARAFSEMFLGCPYGGPGEMYRLARFQQKADGDILFYQRLQAKFWKWEDVMARRGIKRPKGWAPPADADKVTNTDPAYSIVVACQQLATYVVVSRGFSVEEDMSAVGLAAHDDSDREIYAKDGAKWYPTRGTGAVSGDTLCNVQAASKLDVPPRPGTVYVYDPMMYVTVKTFYLKDEEAFQMDNGQFVLKDGQKVQDLKKQNAVARQALELAFKKGRTAEQDISLDSSGNLSQGGPGLSPYPRTISGQLSGSHAAAALRYFKLKTGAKADRPVGQLFDTNALASMVNDYPSHSLFQSVKYNGIFDGNFYEAMPNGYKLIGMGVPPDAERIGDEADWLAKARPVGLARLVLLRRPDENAKTGPLGIDDVIYVSRLLRMYGDEEDQNYGYARYIWSLRNIPYYKNFQPYWVLFIPRDTLADAMWFMGVRGKSVDDLNVDAQVIKSLRAASTTTTSTSASTTPGTLVPQQDYLPVVAITTSIAPTTEGKADYTWRARAVDAGSGDMGEGSVPQVVKDLVMLAATGSKTGATPIAWNAEYFNPALRSATGEAVFTLPDYFNPSRRTPTRLHPRRAQQHLRPMARATRRATLRPKPSRTTIPWTTHPMTRTMGQRRILHNLPSSLNRLAHERCSDEHSRLHRLRRVSGRCVHSPALHGDGKYGSGIGSSVDGAGFRSCAGGVSFRTVDEMRDGGSG